MPTRVRLRAFAGLSFVLLIGLLGTFVYLVFQSPKRTPLLILSTQYAAPWDINPWASRNSDALRSLHGHSLTVEKLDSPNALAAGQWGEFEDSVAQLDHIAPRGKPLLLYINMHGVVDSELRPCLLAQRSEPLDASTWIPVQNLLDHAANVIKEDRPIILFLESSRQSPLVPKDTPNNLFASAIRKLVDQNRDSPKLGRLSFLVSTTTHNSSVDPIDGLPDPFTRFLVAALSGQCDHSGQGGNSNHRISLRELNNFVQQRTESFARNHRGFAQTTFFYSSDSHDSEVAWAPHLAIPKKKSPEATPTYELLSEVDACWQAVHELRQRTPWHNHPALWSRLINSATNIEVAAFDGPANTPTLLELKKEFQKVCHALDTALAAASIETSSKAIDIRMARAACDLWKQVSLNPSHAGVAQAIQRMKQETKDASPIAAPFLWNALEIRELKLWSYPNDLQRLAEAESRLEATRVLGQTFPLVSLHRFKEREVDQLRRSLEDRILADVEWADLSRDIERLFEMTMAFEKWSTWFATVLRAHEAAISELSGLYRSIDALMAIEIDDSEVSLSSQFENLLDKLATNESYLGLASNASADGSLDFVDVTPDLMNLNSRIGVCWRRLLSTSSLTTYAKTYALQALLSSGIVPSEGLTWDKGVQTRLTSRKQLLQFAIELEDKHYTTDAIASHHPCESAVAQLLIEFAARIERGHGFSEAQVPSAISRVERVCSTIKGAGAFGAERERQTATSIARLVAAMTSDEDCGAMVERWNDLLVSKRMLRACDRVLEDFWGEPLVRSSPYFVSVAKRLLDATSDEPNQDMLPELSQATSHWLEKQNAVTHAIQLDATFQPNWASSGDSTTHCKIVPGVAIRSLPLGIATLAVTSSRGTDAITARKQIVNVGPDLAAKTYSMTVSNPKALRTPSTLVSAREPATFKSNAEKSAVCLRFRGHRFESPLEWTPMVLSTSVTDPTLDGPTTILIQDGNRQRRARTLILDCSASMVSPQSMESAPLGNSLAVQELSKLSAAKHAVSEILTRWRGRSDLVSVMLFGHRVAVGTPEQGTLFQNRYDAAFPFSKSLRAFEDVETILPLGRFDDAAYSSVLNRLEYVLPWGQTPLYLAIQQALNESQSLGQGIGHDIIVVSDGRNYQFNPSPERNIGIEQVVQQAKQLGIRIHVIGFGVPEAEYEAAALQYQALAEQTGGSAAMQLANAVELVQRVESISQPETYTVRTATGQAWSAPFGQTLSIPMQLSPNTPLWIEYRNQQHVIPVSPNEAIRLTVAADERLVADEFDEKGEPKRIPLISPNDSPTPFMLGVYPPQNYDKNTTGEESSRQWYLSLLRTDADVPQRPKYVWIEVQVLQVGSDSATPQPLNSYIVSDACWIGNTSVPVLRFQTQNWPNENSAAQLNFWCTDQMPNVIGEIPIERLSNPSSHEKASVLRQWLPGNQVSYQLHWEQDAITLVIQHADESSSIADFVPFLVGTPTSIQVQREYSHEQRTSIHRYGLGAKLGDWPESRFEDMKILVCDTRDLKRKALHLAAPVSIPVQRNVAAFSRSSEPVLKR